MTPGNWRAVAPLQPGAIVLADPKYPDQKESKVRPLLVISSCEFHSNTHYVVCLGITTNQKPDPYLVQLPRTEVKDGYLKYDSQVMCNRVAPRCSSPSYRKLPQLHPICMARFLKK